MTITSRLIATAFHLPQATTYAVAVDRNLEVPMADGVTLLADRWHPLGPAGRPQPVILIRTPYGRSQSDLIARLAAERGYQVVVQSLRGTFGSSGVWRPFCHEQADGQATLAWVAQQPWFAGRLASLGASYQGLSQWALAGSPRESLRAMIIVQSDPDPRSIVYPSGILALETVLAWMYILEYQEKSLFRVLASALWGSRALRPAFSTLPLRDCDRVAFGRTVDFYQEWLAHEPADSEWEALDFGRDLTQAPPIVMVGGW